ncbi:CheR family methyltransferase [Niallia sp. Krafla_26]|uniref:CheR family methyltransferase n=1 Tax=Niallia sp. Krafla_26 TaxID=3064703 RepID=UPI003D1775BE
MNNSEGNLSLHHNNSKNDLEELEIKLLLQGLFEWCGYDFRNYAYQSIKRRIWHRVHEENLDTITELLNKVLHDPQVLQRLVGDFSIHVTEMFRDPLFFLHFREKIVPLLRTYPSIRIWHAGCSTGEEVYSMAILLHEAGLLEKTKIYATDINANALSAAKKGLFPLNNMKKYTNNYLQAGGERAFSDYYNVMNDGVKFHSFLSKNVIFTQHNLVTDRSFNEFHVILCRNVLIYFNKTLQKKVHKLFHESLCMFGVLGLGDKETISYMEVTDCYKGISSKHKLYQKIK